MKIQNINIKEIKPYEKNAKIHPKKQIEQVANSIKRFGWVQPLVIDKDNNLVIGHCRLEAAKLLDIKEVPTLRVENLSEQEIQALRLADNKLNESEWDMDLALPELKGLDEELFDLTGFDKDILIEPDDKDNEVPDVPAEPQSKLGDLYELRKHRVLCGDSTKIEYVEKLMNGRKADMVLTDPPYNTGMSGKDNVKARLSQMFNDKIKNWEKFIKDFINNLFAVTKENCVFYIFIDWRRVQDIKREMELLMNVKNVIVWDKIVHGLGSDYKSTYELCIVGKKGNPKIHNRFGTDYQDIWRVQRKIGRNEMHATVKPLELLEKPIKHGSKEKDIIVDLFLGSGSTLIAAEKTGRICYGMEIDPKYIDVIVQRYVDYTGNNKIKKNGKEIIWKQEEKQLKAKK